MTNGSHSRKHTSSKACLLVWDYCVVSKLRKLCYCFAFFVDNGLVAARCPVWLQSSFGILIKLFERIGLLANSDKMKVVMCVPGRIQVARTKVEYANQQAGNTPTLKHYWVECEVCGTGLAARSLQSHLETQHDIFRLFILNRDIVVACSEGKVQAWVSHFVTPITLP